MRRRGETPEEPLVPVELFDDPEAPAIVIRDSAMSGPAKRDPATRSGGSSRRSPRWVPVAILALIGVIAVSVTHDPESDTATSESSTTRARPTTTVFDDVRLPQLGTAFGADLDVGGIAWVGGRRGLRRVDLGTGAVEAFDGASDDLDVIAVSGAQVVARREEGLIVGPDAEGAFAELDPTDVVTDPDGELWFREGSRARSQSGEVVTDLDELYGATSTHLIARRNGRLEAIPTGSEAASVTIDDGDATPIAIGFGRVAWLSPEACTATCGVVVHDLRTGQVVDWIRLALPGVYRPGSVTGAFGPADDQLAIASTGSRAVSTVDLLAGTVTRHPIAGAQPRFAFDGQSGNLAWSYEGAALVEVNANRVQLHPITATPAASGDDEPELTMTMTSATSIAGTVANVDRPRPMAKARRIDRALAAAAGTEVAGLDRTANTLHVVDLATGSVRSAPLEPPSDARLDRALWVGPPVQVGRDWFVVALGYAFRVTPEGKTTRIAPATGVARAGDDALWLFDFIESPEGGVAVRRWTPTGISEATTVFGASTQATDRGMLVRLQDDATAPPYWIVYDVVTADRVELPSVPARSDVQAAGSTLVFVDYSCAAPDRDCEGLLVLDAESGETRFSRRTGGVARLSPSGEWLVFGDNGTVTTVSLDTGVEADSYRVVDGDFVISDTGIVVVNPWEEITGSSRPSRLSVLVPGFEGTAYLDLGVGLQSIAIGRAA